MPQINEERIREIVNDSIRKVLHLNEMARVGIFNKYDVCVHTNDPGYIPHVHIIDSSTMGMEFDCCVKLDGSGYFSHGRHLDKMNSSMKKMFNDFMNQPCRNPRYQNNYDEAVALWNDNNSDSYIQIRNDKDGNVIVPDFTKIV